MCWEDFVTQYTVKSSPRMGIQWQPNSPGIPDEFSTCSDPSCVENCSYKEFHKWGCTPPHLPLNGKTFYAVQTTQQNAVRQLLAVPKIERMRCFQQRHEVWNKCNWVSQFMLVNCGFSFHTFYQVLYLSIARFGLILNNLSTELAT